MKVLPYLYLGNARSSGDLEALYRYGIGYILNVTPDVPNAFAALTDQFRYMQIPINDHWSQNMAAYFPDAIAFIGALLSSPLPRPNSLQSSLLTIARVSRDGGKIEQSVASVSLSVRPFVSTDL